MTGCIHALMLTHTYRRASCATTASPAPLLCRFCRTTKRQAARKCRTSSAQCMTCCTPQLQRPVLLHNLMLLPPSYMSTAPLSSEEHQKSRVLQPKTSNISAQQAGMYGMVLADSAASPKFLVQPFKSITSPAQTPASLSDTAFELHSSQDFGDVAGPGAEGVSEDAHLAHCFSIPGQIDLHEHGTGIGGISEGAQAISTPRQVQIQDRSVSCLSCSQIMI